MRDNKLMAVEAVVFILLLVGIFYWPKNKNPEIDIPCLDPSILTLQQHLHPTLKIFIDEKEIIIPAHIGLIGDCEQAIHTHDNGGVIHIEAQDKRVYKLKDFFAVWKQRLP